MEVLSQLVAFLSVAGATIALIVGLLSPGLVSTNILLVAVAGYLVALVVGMWQVVALLKTIRKRS